MSSTTTPGTRAQRPTAFVARVAGVLATTLSLLLGAALLGVLALLLLGFRPGTERSDSMAPMLHPGDIIFSRPILASQAHVGEVITFPDPSFKGVKLTHRVRAEQPISGGRIAFTTKGDNSPAFEHWTIAANGHLTRYAFSIPDLGAAFIVISAHPLYLAIAILLALWLLVLQLIWGRGRKQDPPPPPPGPRARLDGDAPRRRRRLLVLGGGILLVATPAAGAAVGYIVTPSNSTPPSVQLAVNDDGEPLFDVPAMRPGETDTACELVTNRGPDAANVGIYSSTSGTGLQNYLNLSVVRGTLPADTAPGSCSGFVADTTNYAGHGPGVIYDGSMGAFPSSAESAIADPRLQWPVGSSVGYEMTISLADNNAAQGLTAVQHFSFGNIVAREEPPQTTGTTPPTVATPEVTQPTATTTPTPAPRVELVAPTVGASSDAVGPEGNLMLSLQLSGKGKILAWAYLWRAHMEPVKVRLHGRTTLRMKEVATVTPLGWGGALAVGPGHYALSIKLSPKVLATYRANPKAYRIKVWITCTNGSAKPYVRALWVSARSLGILAKAPKRTQDKH